LDSAAWGGPTTRRLPPRYAPTFKYCISKFHVKIVEASGVAGIFMKCITQRKI